MKKRFRNTLVLFAFIFCLTSCQPGGGDFVPIPQENTTLESYNDKKDVTQVYNDEQVLLKMHGYWDVENGASSFFIEITNKTQKNLVIEPNGVGFNTNLGEEIVSNEITHTIRGNPPGENAGNQKLKQAKLENGKIKIESGQKIELDTGFYLNIKSFSKSKSYFLGKEVRVEIPIKFNGQEKIYKFAFKFDNYQ